MNWNHRLIRFKEPGSDDVFYKFAEVFYEDDGKLRGYHDPFMWSETVEGMQELAERLLKATTQPALDEFDWTEEDEA